MENSCKLTLENTEGEIQIGQSSETGNIDEEKQSKNTTQYVLDTNHTNRHEPSYTNNWNIVFMRKS